VNLKRGDRVFRNDYRREGSKDGHAKVEAINVMADAEAREGRPKHFWDLPIFIAALFGISQKLPHH